MTNTIIKNYTKVGYSMVIMLQYKCLMVNPETGYSYDRQWVKPQTQ